MVTRRPIAGVAAVVALAVGLWIVLRPSTGPDRVADALGDVDCPVQVSHGLPYSARGRKAIVDGAEVGCGAAYFGVDYLRFRDERAARASVRRSPPRDAYCTSGDEVVVAVDVFQPDFRRMCNGIDGRVIVPAHYRWVTPDG